MQGTVAINNLRRNAALTRRLTGRQSAPPGVINWREFPARLASTAFVARWTMSPLAASASRFAVSRATPSRDDLELLAAGQHHEPFGEGLPRVRRETAGSNTDRPPTPVASAPPRVQAPQFRISRKSVANPAATRRPAASPTPVARAQDLDSQARPGRAGTADNLVMRRSPPEAPEKAGAAVRRETAPTVSSRPIANALAATTPRSRGSVNASGASRSHAHSRDAANSSSRPARPRQSVGRTDSHTSFARKHQPKGSAFSTQAMLLQRKTRPGSPAGAAPRPVAYVAHARPSGNAVAESAASRPADGAYGTTDNFVAVPPPQVETWQATRADDRAGPGRVGAGHQHRPLTIMRQALPVAHVRRAAGWHHVEDVIADKMPIRKAAPARPTEAPETRTPDMREAVSIPMSIRAAPFAPTAAGSFFAPEAATQSPEIDLAQLAEQVSRIISRRLAVERERRGQWK